MIAGYAMLVVAIGALVMVLCVGFGDTEDDESDNAADPRSPHGDTTLRPEHGRGLGSR